MAVAKSRTRRATRSIVDGTTSVLAFVPGLAARALGIVESLISVLDKFVAAAQRFVATVRGKLEELEDFLSDYASS